MTVGGRSAAPRKPVDFSLAIARLKERGCSEDLLEPSSWLLANEDLIAAGTTALDLACGSGRHALLLAAAGLKVQAVDRDGEKIDRLRLAAERLGLEVTADVLDLEADEVDLGSHLYQLALVVHYLHRPLVPALVRSLAPGGVLLYETFTTHQAARGKPTNPAFLLETGELPRLVRPLQVIRAREGEFDGRMVSAVAARKA